MSKIFDYGFFESLDKIDGIMKRESVRYPCSRNLSSHILQKRCILTLIIFFKISNVETATESTSPRKLLICVGETLRDRDLLVEPARRRNMTNVESQPLYVLEAGDGK